MDAGPAEPGQPLVNLPARPGHALVADTASTLGGSATFRSGVLGLALLGAGVFVCLFGSFWLLYRRDEGSDNVTICIGDDDYNAQTIGAVALMIGVAAVWISLRLLRSRRRADRDADPI